MASYFEEEHVYYNYEILEKVWQGHLWYNYKSRHARLKEYFNNFARNHPEFAMPIVQIYDGTKRLMATSKQYRIMKRELEEKTGVGLPVIERPVNVKEDPRNKVVDRRSFSNQSQMDMYLRELSRGREEIYRRYSVIIITAHFRQEFNNTNHLL